MNVWEARLNYSSDGEKWYLFFRFEPLADEYQLSSDGTSYQIRKAWSVQKIPVEMSISQQYGSYSVVQGFSHPLDDAKIENLKTSMKQFLSEFLREQKMTLIEEYDQKINTLQSLTFNDWK